MPNEATAEFFPDIPPICAKCGAALMLGDYTSSKQVARFFVHPVRPDCDLSGKRFRPPVITLIEHK